MGLQIIYLATTSLSIDTSVCKLWMVGSNVIYWATSAVQEPLLFLKPTSSYVREGSAVEIPSSCTCLDHEVELGVVIGRKGRDIPESQAMNHVSGMASHCRNEMIAMKFAEIEFCFTWIIECLDMGDQHSLLHIPVVATKSSHHRPLKILDWGLPIKYDHSMSLWLLWTLRRLCFDVGHDSTGASGCC